MELNVLLEIQDALHFFFIFSSPTSLVKYLALCFCLSILMTAFSWPPAGAERDEGGDPRVQDSKHINSACLDPRGALASHVQATLYKYKWKGQRDWSAFESQTVWKKTAAICMQHLLYGVAKQKGLIRSKWEATDLPVLWKWCIIARTRFASASCWGSFD